VSVVRIGGDRVEQDVCALGAARRRAPQRAAGHELGALSKPFLLPLAWGAGCVDTAGYLLLGGVFTANMTATPCCSQ
jgi:hypothetical protein